ncbi:MAG: carbamoyltransferase [Candidatus Rokubacteria bacterium]|nr:carbamoyltransferase [Candidatus Rokubacteria bacterium]
MNILGINAYHGGSSACLVRDGVPVAAIEEERLRRVKYWAGFPTRSIEFCLREGGMTVADLDHVGISRDPSANLLKKAKFALSGRPRLDFLKSRLAQAVRLRDLKATFCEAVRVAPSDLKAEFHHVEHHLAHMASAFFVSPFSEAVVLSVDGMGDFVSTMWGVGRDGQIKVDGEINFPHSLGFLYTAVSQWLGFPKYGDEGKVMGLAPLGEPVFLDLFRRILRVARDGTFELDLDYFLHQRGEVSLTWDDGEPEVGTMYSPKLVAALGPPRGYRGELTAHHANVAASLQAVLEEAEFALVRRLAAETRLRAICLAGGVALNSAFNGKILSATDFGDVFVQPAANDAGTAMGVCYYILHQVLGAPRGFVLERSYTGPAYDAAAVERALARHGLPFQRLDEESLARRVAATVADGKVVGWFQGRMEWGPRALGNRSIVADPRRAEMKDVLNARVKHREPFRPFAPSILLESVGEYFDQTYPEPFMVKIYGVRPERRSTIPAVTHVDGSGRLQTVRREDNPMYWQLIKEFAGLTGVPVVLNTSFNENEPIVCAPEEAIECFLRTRMDALALGHCLVTR